MKSLILISICFTIFVLVLAWVFFITEGRLKTKLIASATLVFLSVNLAFSFGSFMGYPTKEKWTDNSQVLWAIVREPNLYSGDEGAVYFWLKEPKGEYTFDPLRIFKFVNESMDPRAFVLPYTKQNQSMGQQAQNAIREGKEVTLSLGKSGDNKKDGKSVGQPYSATDLDEAENQPKITVVSPGAHRPK